LKVGAAFLTIAWENDLARVRIGAIGLLVFAGLQLIAVVRYTNTINWSQAGGWLYVLFLVSMLVVTIAVLTSETQRYKTEQEE